MVVVFNSTEQSVVYVRMVRLRQRTKHEGQFFCRFVTYLSVEVHCLDYFHRQGKFVVRHQLDLLLVQSVVMVEQIRHSEAMVVMVEKIRQPEVMVAVEGSHFLAVQQHCLQEEEVVEVFRFLKAVEEVVEVFRCLKAVEEVALRRQLRQHKPTRIEQIQSIALARKILSQGSYQRDHHGPLHVACNVGWIGKDGVIVVKEKSRFYTCARHENKNSRR